jgi:pimeloyl-ACP methyl ester carboxylesterase
MKSYGLALRSAGRGPCCSCCTGWAPSSLDWQAQIERFSERYRVVAIDLRGHGQSMQEGPFDVPTLAADVARWLDEQPEPAWVVGLSLGAMVALELALQLPHKVQGLVLVNGFSEFLLETPKEQERYAMRLKWLRWFGMRPLAWWLGRELFPGPDLAQVRHTFRGASCATKRRPTRRCWRRCPAGRCGLVSAPSGSRWPSSPPVTTICPWRGGWSSSPPCPMPPSTPRMVTTPGRRKILRFNHLLQRILSTH